MEAGPLLWRDAWRHEARLLGRADLAGEKHQTVENVGKAFGGGELVGAPWRFALTSAR